MEFIESSRFTQLVPEYLSDEEFRKMQGFLVENPEAGDLIPGANGLRKLRWKEPGRGQGKRGGLRVIYYLFFEDHLIWFVTLYSKGESADLSPDYMRALAAAAAAEKRQRAQTRRASRRSGRTR